MLASSSAYFVLKSVLTAVSKAVQAELAVSFMLVLVFIMVVMVDLILECCILLKMEAEEHFLPVKVFLLL